MSGYETYSTTADVGIRVQGDSYSQLFENAIHGLNLLYFERLPEASDDLELYSFEFHGDGPENVLVNLLAEQVFLFQNEEKITVTITVHHFDGKNLKADLHTIYCPVQLQAEMEIKAVTYHNVKITNTGGLFSVDVVFDI